jgi:hypothetical protein
MEEEYWNIVEANGKLDALIDKLLANMSEEQREALLLNPK